MPSRSELLSRHPLRESVKDGEGLAEQNFPRELRSWFATKYFEVLSKRRRRAPSYTRRTSSELRHVQLSDGISVGDSAAEPPTLAPHSTAESNTLSCSGAHRIMRADLQHGDEPQAPGSRGQARAYNRPGLMLASQHREAGKRLAERSRDPTPTLTTY